MLLLSLALSLNVLGTDARAADCKALSQAVLDASAQGTTDAFQKLAECDPGAAKAAARSAFAKILSGDDGYSAALTGIKVGANDAVVAWIDGLQSDERASAIRVLGEACNDTAEVQAFFVARSATLGEEFWTQRWYRALANCRVASVQDVLWKQLDKGPGADRGRFFSVLETFARSAGANAVPRLKALAQAEKDGETQANIIAAFADAANVGSVEGTDEKSAALAVASIVELAPNLTTKGVEQARITLKALGDEAASDGLAAVRYKALAQKDGTFLWGTVVVENAMCKNGKPSQRFRVAPVVDPGQTWGDQVHGKVDAAVKVVWELDLAERCKGTGEVKVLVPAEPFANEAAFEKWAGDAVKTATNGEVKKPPVIDEAPVKL